jgi:hypothetical protein
VRINSTSEIIKCARGYSITEYSDDEWTIKLSYPVVMEPVYKLEVENYYGFTWSGTVDQSSKIAELN